MDRVRHPLRDETQCPVGEFANNEDPVRLSPDIALVQPLPEQRMPAIVDFYDVRIVGSM